MAQIAWNTPGAATPTVDVLTAHNISKHYGEVRALSDVSLSVPQGQALAIMGPSGSGKTTLLHCLAGILVPESGSMTIGDEPVSALSDRDRSKLRARRFGFVFQDGQLLPELTAAENVAMPLLIGGTRRAVAIRQATEWLERIGLAGHENRRPGEMSGGQAQRVAIARALAHKPAVVFADEPTGALDQATGHEVMQLLTTATRMVGATLIVVTHDPQVASWCERLVEIRDAMIHDDRPINAGVVAGREAGVR